MSFSAAVYRILIASPADVGDERNVIPDVINEWNSVSAVQSRSVLMPVKWETHSAPLLGGRPQAIINEQLVKDCDLLVGVFWSRIGTHTGVAVSGTAEEIEQFVTMDKPVMLYFSQSPIDPDKIELDQFTTLRIFKEKMRLKGLTESYAGLPDFRQKFARQLAINLNSLLSKKQEIPGSGAGSQIHMRVRADGGKSTAHGKVVPIALVSPPAFINRESLSKDQLHEYLVKAVTSTAGEDGWANIAAVGIYLRTYTPVDYRVYGFQTLKKFLASTKLFEMKTEQKSNRALGLDSASVRLMPKG